MRILVYPHALELGGSQLNAIELAAAVRDLGHEVSVFGQTGPLVARIRELGLDFIAAPIPGRRPSPQMMGALNRVVRERGIDVVHGYEWTTALEVYAGPRLQLGTAAVGTVMSMAVAPFLPRDLPLVVGTEQIAAHERQRGRGSVTVIEPPVDLDHNARDSVDADSFRSAYDIADGEVLIVAVSRLVPELKLEGLLTAVDVVSEMSRNASVRLLIVGGGTAEAEVRRRAEAANARVGHEAIVLTGELADPRPAYAAADICLAMGGSALRAMAFGAPLVVQGEAGYWETLTPESLPNFLWAGWYGVGDGAERGSERLAACLMSLLADPEHRAALGEFAHRVVADRFAVTEAARRQERVYREALSGHRGVHVRPMASAAWGLACYKVSRKWQRLRGRANPDDFNARPVAALGGSSRQPAFDWGLSRP